MCKYIVINHQCIECVILTLSTYPHLLFYDSIVSDVNISVSINHRVRTHMQRPQFRLTSVRSFSVLYSKCPKESLVSPENILKCNVPGGCIYASLRQIGAVN
jgi:hypothetical protein